VKEYNGTKFVKYYSFDARCIFSSRLGVVVFQNHICGDWDFLFGSLDMLIVKSLESITMVRIINFFNPNSKDMNGYAFYPLTPEEVSAAETKYSVDFNGDGVISNSRTIALEYIVIGGGGGGSQGAGGGAGGVACSKTFLYDYGLNDLYLYHTTRRKSSNSNSYAVPSNTSILVVVGFGGYSGSNGGNSSFGDFVAYGGGAGVWNSSGLSGGSGGAGTIGGSTKTQIFNGTAYLGFSGGNNSLNNGAGGGGATSSGSSATESRPGLGGAGTTIQQYQARGDYYYSIPVRATTKACGGNGGRGSAIPSNSNCGGAGSNVDGGNAADNSGSGGGGGWSGIGGRGGSGYVLFKFNGYLFDRPRLIFGNYSTFEDGSGFIYYEFFSSGNVTF
jgi:hypothetical protein